MTDLMAPVAEEILVGGETKLLRLGVVTGRTSGPPPRVSVDGRLMRFIGEYDWYQNGRTVVWSAEGATPCALGVLASNVVTPKTVLSGSSVLTLNGAGFGSVSYGMSFTSTRWPVICNGDSNINAVLQVTNMSSSGFDFKGVSAVNGSALAGITVRCNWIVEGSTS